MTDIHPSAFQMPTAYLNHKFREQLIAEVFVRTGKNLIAQSFTAFDLAYCFQSKVQNCVLRNKSYEREKLEKITLIFFNPDFAKLTL